MKYGEMERLIENYGKKEQKEWLDNILPDPHPCTAGNKEEEHMAECFSEKFNWCWNEQVCQGVKCEALLNGY